MNNVSLLVQKTGEKYIWTFTPYASELLYQMKIKTQVFYEQ